MDIISFIFPKKCLECGSVGKYICRDCISQIQKPVEICINCKRLAIDGKTHKKCINPQGIDAFMSFWKYKGVIRKALIKIKYNYALEISHELADHMVFNMKKYKSIFPKNPLLIPIPLHRRRKNLRGFNQAEEMGKLLATKLGGDFVSNALVRKKMTKPQTELKGRKRKDNVRGAFSLNKENSSIVSRYKSLIIFDDVFTTGSTIKEAAKELKKNGANEVWGITIAR